MGYFKLYENVQGERGLRRAYLSLSFLLKQRFLIFFCLFLFFTSLTRSWGGGGEGGKKLSYPAREEDVDSTPMKNGIIFEKKEITQNFFFKCKLSYIFLIQ